MPHPLCGTTAATTASRFFGQRMRPLRANGVQSLTDIADARLGPKRYAIVCKNIDFVHRARLAILLGRALRRSTLLDQLVYRYDFPIASSISMSISRHFFIRQSVGSVVSERSLRWDEITIDRNIDRLRPRIFHSKHSTTYEWIFDRLASHVRLPYNISNASEIATSSSIALDLVQGFDNCSVESGDFSTSI